MSKLLVLSSRSPLPLQKGDKLRLYHQLVYLAQRHQIVLVCLQHDDVDAEQMEKLEELCHKVYMFKMDRWQCYRQAISGFWQGRAVTVAYFYNQEIAQRIRQIIAEQAPDHIYCQLIRMARYVEGVEVPKTIDYMDSFALRAQRLAEKKGGLVKRFWQFERMRLLQFEHQTYRWFDHHFVISRIDQQMLLRRGRQAAEILQNGVHADYFDRTFYPIDDGKTLVLIGNMSYHPNVMAAIYLVNQVAPLIWKTRPNLKVVIAGAAPHRKVQRLASRQVEVMGYVPDIRSAYARGTIFVAPIFTGSGLQNKILEAMAMKLPCVTTSIVQRSIEGSDDIIRVADDAKGFKEAVEVLLEDEAFRTELGEKGRKLIMEQYSWEATCAPLEVILAKDQKLGQRLSSEA
ncbi:MAG: glycosyltransferase [Saprospiraceae bacterium]|nr:glycosyltransferase [Saprospiraceae bacterium]